MKITSLIAGLVVATAGSNFSNSNAAELEGAWRITQVKAAPWASARPPATDLRGRSLQFYADHVVGPGALNCTGLKSEPTAYLAEGLFQGNLPAPALAAAQAFGLAHFPVRGVRLQCASGVFELHRADADTFLLGLDNRVLTLSHTPGTLAAPTAPEACVQAFLEAHFSGDMGFNQASVNAKRRWMSARLLQRIAAYFAKPQSADTVPAIDGDPFTDSQEYPARFAVAKALVTRRTAQVPVSFSDGIRDRVFMFLLVRKGAHWLVDDLRYERSKTLQDLLR